MQLQEVCCSYKRYGTAAGGMVQLYIGCEVQVQGVLCICWRYGASLEGMVQLYWVMEVPRGIVQRQGVLCSFSGYGETGDV